MNMNIKDFCKKNLIKVDDGKYYHHNACESKYAIINPKKKGYNYTGETISYDYYFILFNGNNKCNIIFGTNCGNNIIVEVKKDIILHDELYHLTL